ncbi:hypothetical protein BJX62DRAFT_243617 [Aspergillus germanicus]
MSNPDLSYHSLGVAICKALACGLHTDSSKATRMSSVTIWSLYFYETWSSSRLGLPAMLRAENITAPLPEHEPFLCCLWTTACILDEELKDFAVSVREQMQIVIGDLVCSLQPLVQTVMLSNLYFHTLVSTFRPLMFNRVGDEGQLSIETSQSASRGLNRRSRLTGNTYALQALHRAAETARAWLMLIVEAIDRCPLIRGLRYMHYYFESGCYILVYESSECPSLARGNYPILKAGMDALSFIPRDPQLLCTSSSVGSMVTALEQSVAPLGVFDASMGT